MGRVRSYRTFSPLLEGKYLQRYISVALVLGSPPAGVTRYPCPVKPGVFTTVGHYMLVVGHEDGKLKLNDPNSPANSERLWDLDEFVQDIKIMWAFKG